MASGVRWRSQAARWPTGASSPTAPRTRFGKIPRSSRPISGADDAERAQHRGRVRRRDRHPAGCLHRRGEGSDHLGHRTQRVGEVHAGAGDLRVPAPEAGDGDLGRDRPHGPVQPRHGRAGNLLPAAGTDRVPVPDGGAEHPARRVDLPRRQGPDRARTRTSVRPVPAHARTAQVEGRRPVGWDAEDSRNRARHDDSLRDPDLRRTHGGARAHHREGGVRYDRVPQGGRSNHPPRRSERPRGDLGRGSRLRAGGRAEPR